MPETIAPAVWVGLGFLGGTLLTCLVVIVFTIAQIRARIRAMHAHIDVAASTWTDDTDLELLQLLQGDA